MLPKFQWWTKIPGTSFRWQRLGWRTARICFRMTGPCFNWQPMIEWSRCQSLWSELRKSGSFFVVGYFRNFPIDYREPKSFSPQCPKITRCQTTGSNILAGFLTQVYIYIYSISVAENFLRNFEWSDHNKINRIKHTTPNVKARIAWATK